MTSKQSYTQYSLVYQLQYQLYSVIWGLIYTREWEKAGKVLKSKGTGIPTLFNSVTALTYRVFPSLSTAKPDIFKVLYYIYFLLSAISATLVRFTGLELCFWAGFGIGSASMGLRLLRWLMPKAKWKTCFAFVCARKKPRNGGRAKQSSESRCDGRSAKRNA